MKPILVIISAALIALSMSGCSFSLQAVPVVSAKIATTAPAACADLAAAGALTTAIAEQVIAANPNNAKVVNAANKVIAGATLAPADCAAISGVVQLGNAVVQAGSAL